MTVELKAELGRLLYQAAAFLCKFLLWLLVLVLVWMLWWWGIHIPRDAFDTFFWGFFTFIFAMSPLTGLWLRLLGLLVQRTLRLERDGYTT